MGDRQKGRTQTMLENALNQIVAQPGREVMIVAHNARYALDLMGRFFGMLKEMEIECTAFVSDRIIQITAPAAIATKVLFRSVEEERRTRQGRGDMAGFTDHAVWELADSWYYQRLQRWAHPEPEKKKETGLFYPDDRASKRWFWE